MSNNLKDSIMSKESTSPDFVAQSQPAFPKKVNRKVNKNKNEVVPQTSGKEASGKGLNVKKSVLKLAATDKCRRKDKSGVSMSHVADKHDENAAGASNSIKNLVTEISSVKRVHSKKFVQNVANGGDNYEEKNQNVFKTNKRTNKVESKAREVSDCENTSEKKGTRNKTKDRQLKSFKEKGAFPKYIPQRDIDKLLKNQDSVDPEYVEGYLRVNPS